MRARGACCVAAIAALIGCGDDGGGDQGGEEVPECTEFQPGADMSGVVWSTDTEQQARLAFTLQVIGDLVAFTRSALVEIDAECTSVGAALGVPSLDTSAFEEGDVAGLASARCDAVLPALGDLRAATQATFDVQPPPACAGTEAVEAECLAACEAVEGCEELCSVRARLDAECPPVGVTFTTGVEPTPEQAARLEAVAAALVAFAAVERDLALIVDLVVAIGANVNEDTLVDIPVGCIPLVLEALEGTVAGVHATVSISSAVLGQVL